MRAGRPRSVPPPAYLLFTWVLVAAAAGAAPRSGAANVLRRAWIEHRGAIFTVHIRLSGRPRWTLSQQASRLQIDLPDTLPNWPPDQFLHAPVGSLGSVRIVGAGGSIRIEIDAAGSDYVVGRQHDDLIIGLAPRGAGPRIAAVFSSRRNAAPSPRIEPRQTARADHAPAPLLAPAVDADGYVRGRSVVVVDPGHGGHDPGTRSAGGVLEKDLALQIGRRLAAALANRGVKALMTRERDVYLTLAQRTAIANQTGADLFVSVHLNWSPNPGTTGMEVYYLNNTTDRATIRLARMENAAERGAAPLDPNLNYILSDLQQQYKATESALLAQAMEQQTVSALAGGFGNDIRGLGAKRGPFYVLVGPRSPAVLVECGFLSNRAETQRLSDPAYQQAMADALADSVVHYLNQDVSAGTL